MSKMTIQFHNLFFPYIRINFMLMKTIYFLLLLISGQFVMGQEDEELCRMVLSEQNAAAKMMNFTQNVNTQNYDVTYHELRFTVNPAVNSISGVVKTTFKALSPMNTVVLIWLQLLLLAQLQ